MMQMQMQHQQLQRARSASSLTPSHVHAPSPVLSRASASSSSSASYSSSSTHNDQASEAVRARFRFRLLDSHDEAERVALGHLVSVLQKVPASRVFACFDIDDTLFRYLHPDDPESFDIQALEPARTVYHACVRHGVRIILVTARTHTPVVVDSTRAQLAELGYSRYEALALRPASVRTTANEIASFKETARRRLVPEACVLAINFGDHYTDLLGDVSDEDYTRLYASRPADAMYDITDAQAPMLLHVKLPHSER